MTHVVSLVLAFLLAVLDEHYCLFLEWSLLLWLSFLTLLCLMWMRLSLLFLLQLRCHMRRRRRMGSLRLPMKIMRFPIVVVGVSMVVDGVPGFLMSM